MYIPEIKIISQTVKSIPLSSTTTFLDFYFKKVGKGQYVSLLLSGGNHELSQYSIGGTNPYLIIKAKGENIHCIHDTSEYTFHCNPFTYLKKTINAIKIKNIKFKHLPLSCGCIGYFGYELKNILERLPQTAHDDLNLPDMYFVFYSTFYIYSLATKKLLRIDNTGPGISRIKSKNNAPETEPDCSYAPLTHLTLHSNFTHDEYIIAIKRIKEYIKAGDIYQANLSQRFHISAPQIVPSQLFKYLFNLNPAPFFAFLDGGDFQILSSSPERFLYLRDSKVETRPIKGTRPRMKSKEEDNTSKMELLSSSKDDAELSMIVDLLRNDLGRVCRIGSVCVYEHKRIEAYTNVYHLVSIIQGRLLSQKSPVDLIEACFPGGSITGCPKIRSMEIIDELESVVRSVYCGSIGYISLDGAMDMNIAIRTIIYRRGTYYFNVGGGIVYDSNPEEEFQETIHKGESIIKALRMTTLNRHEF
ncbi:MAG: aminodeoxychorismate synthase component I [bacterium]